MVSETDASSGGASKFSVENYVRTLRDITRTEGLQALFVGTVPRVGKAVLSGAVQFGSYEFTKGSMSKQFAQTRRSS